MKNKHLIKKLLLMTLLFTISFSSCKKVEFGEPLSKPTSSRGKLPPPALVYNSTLTVTPTSTETVTTTGVYDPNCECYTTPPTNTESQTCPSVNYPIYAGAGGNDTTKGTNVGTVTYTNDGVNLYVTSTFPGPTCPTEIQVWVGTNLNTLPSTSGGVAFGQFPYQLPNATCGSHTFTIPLSSLGTNLCGTNIYITLHASMGTDSNLEGSTEQTAIGYGNQTFNGPRWGWVSTYPVCCSK